jgi:ketosteroid isomerase-like protein
VYAGIDTLRASWDAFNRRDFEAATAVWHPEVELRPAVQGLDVASLYRGREECRGFMEAIVENWESYTLEPEEIIDVPGGRVLVVERWRARGRDGIEIDFRLIDVYTVRDGLIERIDGFRDKTEALEAVGAQ